MSESKKTFEEMVQYYLDILSKQQESKHYRRHDHTDRLADIYRQAQLNAQETNRALADERVRFRLEEASTAMNNSLALIGWTDEERTAYDHAKAILDQGDDFFYEELSDE